MILDSSCPRCEKPVCGSEISVPVTGDIAAYQQATSCQHCGVAVVLIEDYDTEHEYLCYADAVQHQRMLAEIAAMNRARTENPGD